MHRRIDIPAPPEASDRIVEALNALDGVITLSVHRGDSVKPHGDMVSATVLNTSADAVLSVITELEAGSFRAPIVTSSVDTLLDARLQEPINDDHDEALWEEAETALRRHTRLNLNFFLTTAVGAVLAACALISTSATTQAAALVAGGIIAPAFEPLARIALSVVTRHRTMLLRALRSMFCAYATMVAAAVLTILILRAGGHHFVDDLLRDRTFREVAHPPVINLIISAGGAIAGVVMISAGRFTQLAGALVALQILPAAAAIGLAIEVGKWDLAARSLSRLTIDVGFVIAAGLLAFEFKHRTVHSRRPVLH